MEPEWVAGQAGGCPSPGRGKSAPLSSLAVAFNLLHRVSRITGGWNESSLNETWWADSLVLKCWDFTSSGLSRCGSDAFDVNSSQVHHSHSVASGISRFGVSDSVVRPYVARAWAFHSF